MKRFIKKALDFFFKKNESNLEIIRNIPVTAYYEKYEIPSDFSEKQIEMDVTGYLTFMCSFTRRLNIICPDEQETGADSSFNWKGAAYFFQFKKPTGLKNSNEFPIPTKQRKKESYKQKIRRYRKDNELGEHPYSIYFRLRKQAKTASKLQHNILRAFENPPVSRAAYICPTVLKKSDYDAMLNVNLWDRIFHSPFLFREYDLSIGASIQSFRQVPFLRAHATILPHKEVATAKHSYSFDIHGGDVAFHSPEIQRKDVQRLSDFLAAEVYKLYSNEEKSFRIEEIASALFQISIDGVEKKIGHPVKGKEWEWLKSHGKLLNEEFGISQYIVLIGYDSKNRNAPT